MDCPSCGTELAGEFRFCPFCGASVVGDRPGEAREERKVVTVLFADLVGFTARAETLDPEDVRALLTPYHAHLRSELERFGGTVEKFIGDAVMALFGAPTAHEDDPERAVRAALAIRDWVAEQNRLQVRIAVNTGEALVSLDARPSEGEAMAAGDVVNTAARLQTAAPVNGILVGESTWRATAEAIEYRAVEAVIGKGKSEPIGAWEALRARSRFGVDVSQRAVTALVGRRRELDLLVSTLARVREERSAQLVTLVGVPGIGKSRLVHELFRAVEEDAELIRWRQGRSLPYGEGVTFWALAEVVKAQAGILETDTRTHTEEKLARTVAAVASDPTEAQWLERHLRPLAGVSETASASQDEGFAAWRRFVEKLAEERPLVLVFEDLHWADDAMLDFVDGLVERAGGVPLLVLGTARPELLQRRSGWGGGKPNVFTISLPPLTDEETRVLLGALLDGSETNAHAQEALLARAGGNPLFAEQYARVLVEQGNVPELPENVQGIIAARLDALSEPEKRLLQDAAVVGKVFWLGAVEAVDGLARWQAEELLHVLERKEFVQRSRDSSVATESEYAFRHVLIRDVAYSQIPRAARSDKHRRAAAWIESLGRPEEQAELLAHHYLQALELAQAVGLDGSELSGPARRALSDAGDRAAALYAVGAAERFYDAALRLGPDDNRERADLLFRKAVPIGHHIGGGNLDYLSEARDALLAIGDKARAAEAELLISQVHWIEGRHKLAEELAFRALTLVDDLPPSRSVAEVLVRCGNRALIAGDIRKATELASKARDVAEQVGWRECQSEALSILGMVRVYTGEPEGLADVERSLGLAEAAGAVAVVVRVHNSLAVAYQVLGDLQLAYEARLRAASAAERIGSESVKRWHQAVLLDHRYRRGEWDEASRGANTFIGEFDAGTTNILTWQVFAIRAEMRLARGDAEGAAADAEFALSEGRAIGEIQAVDYLLATAAHVLEREAEARELIESLHRGVAMQFAVVTLPTFARAAISMGLGDELVAALEGHPRTRWTEVVRAYVARDYTHAAETLHTIGALPDEAESRLRAGEQLLSAGRREEAEEQLRQALAFYRSVGAARYVAEAERLLAASR